MKKSLPLLLTILVVLCNSTSYSQIAKRGISKKTQVTNTGPIGRQAFVINSIDASNTNYSDLEKLIPILKNVKIVGLGENTHDDGATFKAKMRLVKFLHERLNFEVLSFESSFYGGILANDELDKDQSDFNVINANLPGWFQSANVYPLILYAKETRKSNSTLMLSGFDQEKLPNGIPNITRIINTLSDMLGLKIDIGVKGKVDSLLKAVNGPIGNTYYPAFKGSKSWNEAVSVLKKILKEFEHSRNKLTNTISARQYMLLDLGLQSFLMTVETMEHGGVGTLGWNMKRDYFMSKRVQWLTDSLYPGKKIILWAASGHLMRNNISIERKDSTQYLYNIYPFNQAGDFLHQLYKDKYYSIAFISYSGEHGMLYPNMENFKDREYREPISSPQKGSFEEIFHQWNSPYLFINLYHNNNPELSKKRMAHPFGYYNDTAEWGNIIDAFFFIDRMEPDVYRKK